MTAVILAGGKSRRMKTEKAFVEVGGKRLIERVLTVITPLFTETVINSNTPEAYAEWNVPVVPDIFPNKGALGGIYAGLMYAKTEYIFCVACDMPFLNQNLIRYMQHHVDGYDVIVPKAPDGLHPLHANYSRQCQRVIRGLLEQNTLKISEVFSRVPTRYITESQIRQFDPNFESFLNVNTLEDLAAVRSRFSN